MWRFPAIFCHPGPSSLAGCWAPCKRTRHCWPTTPNIVGCYMLRPFTHPVACCWMLLRNVWNRSNVSANNSQDFFCSVIAKAQRNNVGCWGHARPVRMVYKNLWAVSFPPCTAGLNIVRSGTHYRPRWPFSFLSGYIYASQIESLQLRWCGLAREEMSKDPHYP